MLARAGLDRFTPHATWILLLAANAPDIDVVSAFGGSLSYLHYHRHLTHSLVALPVMALLCVLAVRLVSRKPVNWLGAYCIALIGVASHLLLDWTNVYGVRLLLPFSARWLRLDITGVIDFWIWGALLLAIFAPMLSRLVNSEIGATRPAGGGARRGFAIFAIAFLMVYDGARYVTQARVVETLDSRIYSGAASQRTAAFPTGNILQWRGLVETGDAFHFEDVNLLTEFDPTTGRVVLQTGAITGDRGRAAGPGFSAVPAIRAVSVLAIDACRQSRGRDARGSHGPALRRSANARLCLHGDCGRTSARRAGVVPVWGSASEVKVDCACSYCSPAGHAALEAAAHNAI